MTAYRDRLIAATAEREKQEKAAANKAKAAAKHEAAPAKADSPKK